LSARDVIVNLLLALGVASSAVCVAGVLAGRTAIDRLHYAGAATTLPSAFIAAAVVVKEGGRSAGINALVIAAALLVFGPVLTHATARVARAERR
jgi:multicomponent Na+:H+ antiporter subunit G